MWYYTNGKVASEYIYVLGSIEGKVAFFHEEGGMKSSTMYQGNKRNGAHLEYDKENRKVVEGSYVDDLKNGKWLYYDQEGAIVRKERFKKGVQR